MSKFKVKSCVTIDVPESFRKDLQDLCNEIEECDDSIVLYDVISLILDAHPNGETATLWDGSLVVNFVKSE